MAQQAAQVVFPERIIKKTSPFVTLLRFVRNKPVGAIAAAIVLALGLSALFAPLITPYDPLSTRVGPIQDAPSTRFLFGTDSAGRDVLSRVVYGGRTSLMTAVLAVAISTFVGTLIGLTSGYFEGKLDLILQRMIDSIMSFPAMILALAVISVLGPSTRNLVITIAVVMTPQAARIVRGSVLSVKQNVYVEAARSIGAKDTRILLFHILPNVVAPILIIVSVQVGYGILVEASLSFLGLGTPPPNPSWGSMLSEEGRQSMETAPWLAIFPGLFLSLAVMGLNLFGDALRDVMDPKMRGRTRT